MADAVLLMQQLHMKGFTLIIRKRGQPMTQEEHDRIVANCAKVQGLELYTYADGTPYSWLLDGKELCRFGDYDPTANTIEGREQANELWKKLDKTYNTAMLRMTNHSRFTIYRGFQAAIEGKGPWWNSALSAAVAELVEVKEKL